MKKAIIFFFVCALVACGDKVRKTESSAKAVGELPTNSVEKVVTDPLIPTYDFEGFNQFLTKENDTTYVINFWATWCKPCIKELPAFEKLNAEYSTEKVKVLLVSLDFPDKIEKQVIPFIEKNNIRSEVILLDDDDSNTWIPKVSKEWSGAIPATIIYSNTARKFYERSFTYEELEEELKIIM